MDLVERLRNQQAMALAKWTDAMIVCHVPIQISTRQAADIWRLVYQSDDPLALPELEFHTYPG